MPSPTSTPRVATAGAVGHPGAVAFLWRALTAPVLSLRPRARGCKSPGCRCAPGGGRASAPHAAGRVALYAEQTFDGLTASAAKQLSRQEGVLLTLERHSRITLDGRNAPLATTALRALSVVQNTYGEHAMLSVYDRARDLRPGRAIVEQTVKSAMRELAGVATLPAKPPADQPPEDEDLADPELEDELSEEVNELVDRLASQ